MAEGQRSLAVGLERGLGVLPGGRARRGVPGVADAEIALERSKRGLVEHLRDQAELLVDQQVLAVRDGHAGRLLAPVLLGEQTEVGEPCDVIAGSPYAEEAALLFR